MSVQVPVLRCTAAWEQLNSSNQITKKEFLKLVEVGLSRNEFKEIILEINILGKIVKTRKIVLQYDSLKIFRKFVKEGKLTLSFSDTRTKIFLSNAPPNELVIFTKSLASKLAGAREQPRLSSRAKLLSEAAAGTEGISPVTGRDVAALRR